MKWKGPGGIRLTSEEVVRRGQEIYDRDLKGKLEPQHNGDFITINVLNGDYALNPDPVLAHDAMKAKYPDGIFFGGRVGRRFAYRLGPSLRVVPRQVA
jgi:hypothetical protein